MIGSIFLLYCEITDLRKRHKGQNLQCQLANEDDLQLKSVIEEIVLRIVFYIRIDYHRNDFKQIVLFWEIHSPLIYIARIK